MRDNEETTAELTTSGEPKPVYEWTVLKKRDPKADTAFTGAIWVEVGTIDSEYISIIYPASLLGELKGSGEYLCIRGDSYVYRVSVVGHTVWEYENAISEEPT